MPILAYLRQIYAVLVLILFVELVVREQLQVDEKVAKNVQHPVFQVANLQAKVHPLQDLNVFFSFEQRHNHRCNLLNKLVQDLYLVLFFVVFSRDEAK